MKNTILFSLYQYNADLFVELFCENKSKPQLQCNGKCQLSTLYKEQQEEDARDLLEELQTEVVYYLPMFNNALIARSIYGPTIFKHTAHYSYLYSFRYNVRYDRPPDLSC